MNHRIRRVEPGSLAARLGLKAGDWLKKIAGQNVIDFVDLSVAVLRLKARSGLRARRER